MTFKKVPKHIAIIMDGNGRWAKKRNLPRISGHLEGVKRVEEIVQAAKDFGVKVLTLYTFSTENWQRPQDEVSMLMKTICSVLDKKVKRLVEENSRFSYIGRHEGIPPEVLQSFHRAANLTKNNTGMILNLAFNYGSRVEILDAVKSITRAVVNGELSIDKIDEDVFSEALYSKGLPDPDLLIRTSGEKRISNFLLWQLSYAEFYFTETLWPDFTEDEFLKAIQDYQKRDRRFGRVKATPLKS